MLICNFYYCYCFFVDVRMKIFLYLVVVGGYFDVVRLFVEVGFNLDNIDKFGKQLLMYVVVGVYVEIVKFLFEIGLFVRFGRNWYVFYEVCKVGSFELV